MHSTPRRPGHGSDRTHVPPIAHHIVMRLRLDRVIAPTTAARRILASVMHEQGHARGLLAFRAADTHVHSLLACTRDEAAAFAGYAAASIHKRLALPVAFAPAFIKPVVDQSHLYNTFWYELRQEERHGTNADPAHDASILPDLLGLRVIGAAVDRHRALHDRVRAFLPRVQQQQLVTLLGAGSLDDAPPSFVHLAHAAAAAVGVPQLDRCAECVTARRAAVHAARSLPSATTAELLGLSTRSVRRLCVEPVDARIVRAVELQLRLAPLLPAFAR